MWAEEKNSTKNLSQNGLTGFFSCAGSRPSPGPILNPGVSSVDISDISMKPAAVSPQYTGGTNNDAGQSSDPFIKETARYSDRPYCTILHWLS